ncbi:MAG: EAL domain-containing protein [Parahaliea sp.]
MRQISALTPQVCGLLMLWLTTPIPTQAYYETQMVFQTLSLEDGLSQSTINDMLQDSRGYLWFATENGLNRYDGKNVEHFMRDPSNPHALPNDFIWSLAEDVNGDIWLATDGAGLVRWQRESGRFNSIPLPSGAARLARVVMIDNAGDIWMGTRGAGLLRFNGRGQFLGQYRFESSSARSTGNPSISSLLERRQNEILVGTEAGLYKLNSASGETIRLGGADRAVSSMLLDRSGALWIGTYDNGLERTETQTRERKVFRHMPDQPNSLSNNQVRDILQDSSGRIWVATQHGLNIHLPEVDGFHAYFHRDSDRYSLTDDRLMSLYESRDGILWIGTRLAGANRWSPRSWVLGAREPDILANTAVLAFADSDAGRTWVGGFGAPLVEVDAAGSVKRVFNSEHGLPDRGTSAVTALLRDRASRLWIGTMDAGLQIYDSRDNSLQALRHQANNSHSLGADGIMCLLEDSTGNIWAGSFGGGLARIDPQTLEVDRFADGLRITAIREDSRGRLWLGTDGNGLVRFSPDTGALLTLRHNPDSRRSLGMDTVFSLHIAKDHTLWVGTAGAGLAYLNVANQGLADPTFAHLTTSDGLSNNVINGIVEDDRGLLWLSSNAGLMRLNPRSREVSYFHRVQGLQSEEFNYGAYYRGADGRLFFGGTGGYNAFDPDSFRQRGNGPPVAFTTIEVDNQPLANTQALGNEPSLTIAHYDDVITIEYVALDYTAPERNRYSVMLEGFDQNWTPVSARNRSTYTNLDPGNYVFKVRAANSEGVWSEQPLALALNVTAAPWETPYALLLYALLAGLLIYGIFRWRMNVVERETRVRQLAYYDRSTGLPNLDLLTERAEAALQQAQAENKTLILISLRLTTLRRLRGSFGGEAIDEILRTLSPRLTQQLFGSGRTSATRDLGRISETELAVFILVGDPMLETVEWVQRLHDVLSAPIDLSGRQLRIPVQAGIATSARDGNTAATLIKCASIAAHDNNIPDTSPFAYYSSDMTSLALDRLSLESELRQAIRDDALSLYLQGKFDRNGKLVGAEALLRWEHPKRGMVSPGVFVPLAEETDLILELDQWVLENAFHTLQRWQQQGRPTTSLAVNVSAESFVSGHLVETLTTMHSRYPIEASTLEIELTETALASDMGKVTDTLEQVQSLGHPLALDDFGTGYSSLIYLQRFPLDMLKIDQAFVQDLEQREDQQALCRAIIALAGSLNLHTTAEGIENREQLDILVRAGCNQLQGFYLHHPEPIVAFESRFLSPRLAVTG